MMTRLTESAGASGKTRRRGVSLFAHAAVLILAGALGTGCTALKKFGDYMFTDDAGVQGDMGMMDAGPMDLGGDPSDGGVDGGPMDMGFDEGVEPPTRERTGFTTVSGAATLTDGTYTLRVVVGGPQPIGEETDGTNVLSAGVEP